MFKDINCITTIDFSNFGPSEISDMSGMFSGCSALKSINFKNLDTSSVTDMSSMFYGTSIISLDLSKFNTSKVQNMKEMFSFAQNLETVILSNFDTSSVTNMDKMFYYASSLTLLNLTNFDISSVTSMNLMFKECNSLKYLNLISFKERNDIEASTLFSDNIVNLTYCLDKNISPKINENLESKNASNNCENICFTNSKFIPKKIQCIDDCSKDDIYICEYKNICYEQCPEIEDVETIIPVTSRIIESIITQEILTAQISEIIEENIENKIIEKTEKAEEIINSKNIEIFINTGNATVKDEIIKNFKKDIINGELEDLIRNLTIGKKDLLIKTNGSLFQITTTENQKNNDYKNISTLDLGGCEDKLKSEYHIDQNLSLIIFKVYPSLIDLS